MNKPLSLLFASFLLAGLAGCGSDKGSSDSGIECPTAAAVTIDPSTFPACCEAFPEASAHCVPASFIPDAFSDRLAPCEGDTGACVPDKFIESGGAIELVSCASIGGEGRCLSVCIPEVGSVYQILPKDVCDAGEVCVPCTNPLDGQSTGICDASSTAPDDSPDATPDASGPGADLPSACP